MRWFWLIIGIILFVAGVAFALLNAENIDLNLFVFQFKTTLAMALLGFFVVGGLLGLLIGYLAGRFKVRAKLKTVNGR